MAGSALGSSTLSSYPESSGHKYDRAGQQEFMGLVAKMRPSSIGFLPDLSPAVPHDWSRSICLLDYIGTGEDKILLNDYLHQSVGIESFPDRLEFRPQSTHRVGRKASRTNVFFGPLTARYFNEGKDIPVQVAVKRMSEEYFDDELMRKVPNDVDQLLHEVAMNQYLTSLGFTALNVIGVALHGDDNIHLNKGFTLTEQVDPLTTFDTYGTDDWDEMDDEEVQANLDKILETAVVLNRAMLFHGDFMTKNVTMEGVVIDTETMVSGRDIPDLERKVKSGDRERVIDLYMSDQFARLAMSLDQSLFAGRRKPVDDIERFEQYCQMIFVPYYEALHRLQSPYIDILEKAIKGLIDRRAHEALYGYDG